MAAKLDTVYRKRDDIVARRIAGETLLVPIRGELAEMQQIFALNPVAEFIWERLDGAHPLGEILDGILEDFEVGSDEARADMERFVRDLLKAELIVEAP